MKAPAIFAALILGSYAFADNDVSAPPATPATLQLQALAEKHQDDVVALDAQRDAALSHAQEPYLAALASSENAALAASQLAVVAAITKERVAVTNKGPLSVEPPQDLPKSLQPARKKYLDTIAQIAAAVSTRQEKLDVDYLRSLTALQSSAGTELSKAIEEEKLRFLSRAKLPNSTSAPLPATGKPSPTKPAGMFVGFSKPLKDLVEIVPWADFEMATKKFKPNDKTVPDELRATVNGQQIQISGVKKTSTSTVDGQLIAHWGKLVLISAPAPQSGTLRSKTPYVEDGPRYGIVLELTDGKLKSSLKFIKEDKKYDWSVKIDGDAFLFEITQDGEQVNSLRAPAGDVKAFGFASTVRYPGNKADLVVNVNPSATIK